MGVRQPSLTNTSGLDTTLKYSDHVRSNMRQGGPMHYFSYGSSITQDDGALHTFTKLHLRAEQGSTVTRPCIYIATFRALNARFCLTFASSHCRSANNNIAIVGLLSRLSRNVPLPRRKICTKMTCSVTELDTDSAVKLITGTQGSCLSFSTFTATFAASRLLSPHHHHLFQHINIAG